MTISKSHPFNKRTDRFAGLIFFLLLILVAWFYQYPAIIDQKPQSFHSYRQSDCLSLTLNYYQDNLPFYKPAIHNQFADGGKAGYSAGEFPLLYYTVAQIWKVVGYHLWIYRGLNTLILFLGLVSLFSLLKGLLKDVVWAGGITLMVLGTPVIGFYACNYLTNTTSLGLVLMASYMFYKYGTSKKKGFLIFCILLFTLAGLMKVSSLITWVAWIAIWIMHELKFFRKLPFTLFHHRWIMVVGIIFLLLALFGWYKYASIYNGVHRAHYTPNNLLPIWKMSRKEINTVWVGFTNVMIYQWYYKFGLVILSMMYLTVLIALPKTFKKILPLVLFLFIVQIGCIAYCLCWFAFFGNHDYYLIEIMPFWIILLICFAMTIKTISHSKFVQTFVKSVFIVCMLFSVYYTKLMMDIKYNRYRIDIHKPHILFTAYERGFWQFVQEQHVNKEQYLLTLDSLLDKLDVGRDEMILCLPDNTINVPFVAAGRKGNNEYAQGLRGKELIEYMKTMGNTVLVVLDPAMLSEPYMEEYLPLEIGSNGPIHVFRLSDH